MTRWKAILSIPALALLAASCSSSDEPEPQQGPSQTVLVYMVASNSLSGYSQGDINEMMQGMTAVRGSDCHLLLYLVDNTQQPTLYEIETVGGKAQMTALKTYSDDTKSTTIKRMSEVVADMQQYGPAHRYGLVLWSHATGWLQVLGQARTAQPQNFGDDGGAQMAITELAEALPDRLFHFIYADACYMGCIEVAYQLRNKADYYISSPTETMAYGMPYDDNVPCFFQETPDLTQACTNTYDFYANAGSYCTISLVDCSQLEQLADLCRQIHAAPSGQPTSTDGLQCYTRQHEPLFYDFLQYTSLLASQQQATELYQLTNKAVVYKAATPQFITLTIDPDHFSGLSTYILGTSSYPINESYYKTLDWYKAVYE